MKEHQVQNPKRKGCSTKRQDGLDFSRGCSAVGVCAQESVCGIKSWVKSSRAVDGAEPSGLSLSLAFWFESVMHI